MRVWGFSEVVIRRIEGARGRLRDLGRPVPLRRLGNQHLLGAYPELDPSETTVKMRGRPAGVDDDPFHDRPVRPPIYRMCDRRFIREELIADIMVFDLKGLREVGTFSYPHHLAEGVTYGMVNGELAIDDGAFTTCGAVASSRALARTCAKRVSGGAAAADPGAPGIGR